jgi:hypothetical protein
LGSFSPARRPGIGFVLASRPTCVGFDSRRAQRSRPSAAAIRIWVRFGDARWVRFATAASLIGAPDTGFSGAAGAVFDRRRHASRGRPSVRFATTRGGRFDVVAVSFRLKIEVSKIGWDTISHFNIAHDRPGAGSSGRRGGGREG